MTIDEALAGHPDWDNYESDLPVYDAWSTLAAEVQRLRGVVEDLEQQLIGAREELDGLYCER